MMALAHEPHHVYVPAGAVRLEASLRVPADVVGLVIFAHGSGSSRFSGRNRVVADYLFERGLATLLMDLLTRDEEQADRRTREYRFDTVRLAARVVAAIDWAATQPGVAGLPICCFGASTGAAAALMAAAERPHRVRAVVARGGRPDLAGEALGRVQAPTLLIVGALDDSIVAVNREARTRLSGAARLEVVPGAGHLFEEPGALDDVARLTAAWCWQYLDERP
jgi:dienelactone hydrolase